MPDGVPFSQMTSSLTQSLFEEWSGEAAAAVPRSELEKFWTELHNIMNHLGGTDDPDEFVSIMEATQDLAALQRAGVESANKKLTDENEELKDFALKIHNFTYKDENGVADVPWTSSGAALDFDAILKRLNHDEKAITYDFEAIYEEMYEGRTENEKLKKEIEESKKVDTDDV